MHKKSMEAAAQLEQVDDDDDGQPDDDCFVGGDEQLKMAFGCAKSEQQPYGTIGGLLDFSEDEKAHREGRGGGSVERKRKGGGKHAAPSYISPEGISMGSQVEAQGSAAAMAPPHAQFMHAFMGQ